MFMFTVRPCSCSCSHSRFTSICTSDWTWTWARTRVSTSIETNRHQRGLFQAQISGPQVSLFCMSCIRSGEGEGLGSSCISCGHLTWPILGAAVYSTLCCFVQSCLSHVSHPDPSVPPVDSLYTCSWKYSLDLIISIKHLNWTVYHPLVCGILFITRLDYELYYSDPFGSSVADPDPEFSSWIRQFTTTLYRIRKKSVHFCQFLNKIVYFCLLNSNGSLVPKWINWFGRKKL